MPRIVVGIPTLDEATTIAHVAQSTDEGLKLVDARFGPIRAKIVNSDSLSQDGTARIFSAQQTFFSKQQVSTSGNPGKGKNVRRLLDIAAEFDADCLLLLDGDLYSIRPEWVPTIAAPILRGNADFVYPRYLRNRFEGGITNHLCVPLIYSVYGKSVRQPIAGDFGLSRNFIDLARRAAWPAAADHYGVDITLTITAIEASCRMAEARLDQKVHRPVITEKFCWTFAEVCEAALSKLRGAAVAPRAEAITSAGDSINDNVAFPFDETTAALLGMAEDRFRAWSETNELEDYGMGRAVARMVGHARSRLPLEADAYPDLWREALIDAIRAAMSGANEAGPMTALLLPAFLIKMCSFWARVRTMLPGEVEKQVAFLAQDVRRILTAEREAMRS
jgi:hypothetical protein